MCLNLGQTAMLIPPSDSAKRWCDYFKVSLILIGIVCFANFMAVPVNLTVTLIEFLMIVAGYFAIRNPEGYNYQFITVFLMFDIIVSIFAILNVILWAVSSEVEGISKLAAWQYYFFIFALMAAPIVHTISSYVTYKLYRDMKLTIDGAQQSMLNDDYRGGRADTYSAPGFERHGNSNRSVAPSGTSPSSTASSSSSTSSSGFKAFSGQGHRLG